MLGTYNNQYMVIDLKKVELKKNVHDDALWVVKQIPTKVAAGDMMPMLRAGKLSPIMKFPCMHFHREGKGHHHNIF